MGACWLERLLPDAARPSQWRSGRRFKAEAERRPLKCRSHTGPLGAGQPHRGSSGGPPHSSETGGRADLRFWHLERRVELGNTKTLLQAPKSRGGLVAHGTVPLRPATLNTHFRLGLDLASGVVLLNWQFAKCIRKRSSRGCPSGESDASIPPGWRFRRAQPTRCPALVKRHSHRLHQSTWPQRRPWRAWRYWRVLHTWRARPRLHRDCFF